MRWKRVQYGQRPTSFNEYCFVFAKAQRMELDRRQALPERRWVLGYNDGEVLEASNSI